jgi:hypothetical protein
MDETDWVLDRIVALFPPADAPGLAITKNRELERSQTVLSFWFFDLCSLFAQRMP